MASACSGWPPASGWRGARGVGAGGGRRGGGGSARRGAAVGGCGLLRRRGRGVVTAFGGRRPGVVVLDGVLQPRREPVEDVGSFLPRDVGTLRAGVLAVCPRPPADVVQPVSISRIFSKAVLAGDHAP